MKNFTTVVSLFFVTVVGFGMLSVSAQFNDLDQFVYLPIVRKPLPTPTATPIPTSTPVPTAVPTATPQPTSTPQPTPTTDPCSGGASSCSCAGNIYNCSDFSTQCEAQACYEKCLAETGQDIHRLDRDNDGRACESLPRSEELYGMVLFGGD